MRPGPSFVRASLLRRLSVRRTPMPQQDDTRAMGWLRDLPDFRDYTANQQEAPTKLQKSGNKASVQDILNKVDALRAPAAALPAAVDLRTWMSPIENQGSLGSCTANAGVGLVEYFERRAHGKHVNRSRLFLYKAT